MSSKSCESNSSTFTSPVFYRDWSQTLDRDWQEHLTPFEFAIIRFIFDRTVGWGKEWERIPLRHFTEGVIDKDGKCHGRSCLKPTTAKAALASLSERGAILTRHENNCNRYSLNYKWTPKKKPKRLKKTAEKEDSESWSSPDQPVSRVATIGKSRGDLHKRGKGKRLRQPQDAATADAVDVSSERGEMKIETRAELEDSLNRVATSLAKRDAKKKEGTNSRRMDGGLVPSLSAMRRIWTDLHAKHCPQIPCADLPDKSLHMLRSYVKEWNMRNPVAKWVDFLGWVFENWDTITRTSFRWMSPKPICPEPNLVASAKLRVSLEEGWNRRAAIQAIYALPPRERDVRFFMFERGATREVAEKWVTARKEHEREIALIVAEHDKLEVAERDLSKQRQALGAASIRMKREAEDRDRRRAALNALTKENRKSIEDGMCASLRKKVAADAKEREKEAPVQSSESLPPRCEIPLSFPAWDE